MRSERAAYRSSRGNNNRSVQELQSQVDDLRSLISQNQSTNNDVPPIGQVDVDVQSRISQVTVATNGPTIMGGRQQQQHRRNNTPAPPGGLYDITGRRISQIISSVRQASSTHVEVKPESPPNTPGLNEVTAMLTRVYLGPIFTSVHCQVELLMSSGSGEIPIHRTRYTLVLA